MGSLEECGPFKGLVFDNAKCIMIYHGPQQNHPTHL